MKDILAASIAVSRTVRRRLKLPQAASNTFVSPRNTKLKKVATVNSQKEGDMKLCCYQCGNPKFGMMRYHLRGKTFCKMSCRNDFVAGEPRKKPPEEVIHKPPDRAFDVIT